MIASNLEDFNRASNIAQNCVNQPKFDKFRQKGLKTSDKNYRPKMTRLNQWKQFCELNDIFPRYRAVSLDTLCIPSNNTGSFKDKALHLLQHPTSVILMGRAGTGKTHFMFTLLKEMFDRKGLHVGDVRYFDHLELDRRIQEEINKYRSSRYIIETISSVPVLLIDDFGTDTGTQRHERDFYEIFNKRFGKNLITILTTNLDENGILSCYGERIASRFNYGISIEFNGPDLRDKRNLKGIL